MPLSRFALGASIFTGRHSPADVDRLYALFRSAGGTTFDSAHCYCFWLPGGAGIAERTLADTIRRHHDESNVQIVTKGGHPAAPPAYPRPDAYLSPEVLSADIADSLRNLSLPIHYYLLHRDDPRVPVAEIIDTLHAHVAAGHIQNIGVSNWTTARIDAANAYARAHNRTPLALSQPQFSLAHPAAANPTTDPAMRHLTDADIAWHTANNFPAMPYSPTAGGYFAKPLPAPSPPTPTTSTPPHPYDTPTSRARHARVTALAATLGVTPNQVALAYLLSQPFPTIPILGTTNPTHLADSLAATSIHLTSTQLTHLRHGN